jgi:hypothetical protein
VFFFIFDFLSYYVCLFFFYNVKVYFIICKTIHTIHSSIFLQQTKKNNQYFKMSRAHSMQKKGAGGNIYMCVCMAPLANPPPSEVRQTGVPKKISSFPFSLKSCLTQHRHHREIQGSNTKFQ